MLLRSTFKILLLLLLQALWLHGFAIDFGQDIQTVNKVYGAPRSKAVKGAVESWYYAEGSVVFEAGKVKEINFRGREPRLLQAQVANTPTRTAQMANAATPTVVQRQIPQAGTDELGSARPSVAAPRVRPSVEETPPGGFSLSVWPFVCFAVIAALVVWNRVTRSTRDRFLPPEDTPERRERASALLQVDQARVRPTVKCLTREALDRLEWRRIEELAEMYFAKTGWIARRNAVGADGGVDVLLSKEGASKPVACVQCKQRSSDTIGVSYLREFYGVMVSEEFAEGFYVTTSTFTPDAVAFAAGKPITLIDGHELVRRVQSLSDGVQAEIVQRVFRDDYMTPTCPSCDVKLVLRATAQPFWGCKNFPRCKTKIHVSKVAMVR